MTQFFKSVFILWSFYHWKGNKLSLATPHWEPADGSIVGLACIQYTQRLLPDLGTQATIIDQQTRPQVYSCDKEQSER